MSLKLEATQVDEADYETIMLFTKSRIPFHFIYAALKYQKDGLLEEIRLSLYEVLHGEQKLYCVLHEYAEGKSIKVLINTDERDPEFVRAATFAIMDKIHPILDIYEQFYCSLIRQDIREAMLAHPKLSASHTYRPMDEPMITYYMDDQQCELLESMDIKLPEDYYFIELTEEHAKQICDEQIHTGQSDVELTALRLRKFPGVGVAYKQLGELAEKPGNLVCYEYTDGMGMISLLYCQRPHRGKGLATMTEKKIAQRNLKELGVRPFKAVSINRPRVLQMSAKSKLWTACTDEKQNEEHYHCILFSKTEMPSIAIYEN